MKNTYLTIVAVLALVTAAALTPMAVQQQVFAQAEEVDAEAYNAESETNTEVEAKNKCNNSGFSRCEQTATSTLTVAPP